MPHPQPQPHSMSHAPPTVPILNERHPVHGLVQQTLPKAGGNMSAEVKIHPNIPLDDVRYALTKVGAGLDHTIGEQAMALGDFSIDTKKQPYAAYLLVTDRRLVGTVAWLKGVVCDVRFSEIDEVRFKKGMLTVELKVRAGDTWHDLSFGEYQEELRNFLRPLYEQPKENREPPIRPLCAPTAEDPTGATTALAWMPVPDPRTELLLTYTREAARQGRIPVEAAQDLVARLTLAYRNLCFGRGQHQGRSMSPVSANDLSQIMVELFGQPLQHVEHPVRSLVLPSTMKSDVGAAVAESAVGLAALAVVGVGWTRRARASVPNFTFMVKDTGPFASYRLLQTGGSVGLHRKVPGFTDDVHYNLMRMEESLLLRRCVHGWNLPPLELMGADPNDVLNQLTEVVGPFDPSVLAR